MPISVIWWMPSMWSAKRWTTRGRKTWLPQKLLRQLEQKEAILLQQPLRIMEEGEEGVEVAVTNEAGTIKKTELGHALDGLLT